MPRRGERLDNGEKREVAHEDGGLELRGRAEGVADS